MGRMQRKIHHQQQIEELCGVALRALTGQADWHFRGSRLYRALKPVPVYAAHLQNTSADDDLNSFRGISDGLALRLQYTDEDLHQSLCPEEPVERLVFELLEQLRVESLAPAHLPGVASNLEKRFEYWAMQFHHAGLSDSALGNLLYTLAQISWARLNARQVLEQTEDFIEATRAGIVPLIGHDLAGLKAQRQDQRAYARHALSIAATIHELMQQAQQGQSSDNETDQGDDPEHELRLLLDFDDDSDNGIAAAVTGSSKAFAEADSQYRIFSARYDREVAAATLVRPELLKQLRQQLDSHISRQGINLFRLARNLAALFSLPVRDGWSFGEEEGYIDGRRLSQLLTSPAERRLFQQVKYQPQANSVVSVLVDCSGSMKAHIESIALFVDVFARALDLAAVQSEILGFTTGGWNGGRVMQDWMAKRRPKHPGRLNELCHMIYKDADTPWRRARPDIAAMLKSDLFREGIDGEAVEWACQRLNKRDAARRVLIVISDGCPMDTATNLANDEFYLDNHLKTVIARHEQSGDVEIFGLGVGLDLSPFYRHSLAVDLSPGLQNDFFAEVLQLLARKTTVR